MTSILVKVASSISSNVSSTATGMSLTAVTVIVKVAIFESSVPSLTLKVKESSPL